MGARLPSAEAAKGQTSTVPSLVDGHRRVVCQRHARDLPHGRKHCPPAVSQAARLDHGESTNSESGFSIARIAPDKGRELA